MLGVFADTGFANQRHRQALRAGGVVKTKAAFHAQAAVVGRAVASIHTDDLVVLDVIGQQTAHATKRAHRVHFFVHHLGAHLRLRHKRTRGAGLHALAAGHAAAVAHGVVQVKHDFAVRAAHGVADHVVHLLFTAGAHAAVALNASIQVDGHRRMRKIRRRLLAAQGLQRRPHRHPHPLHPLAQLPMLPHHSPSCVRRRAGSRIALAP